MLFERTHSLREGRKGMRDWIPSAVLLASILPFPAKSRKMLAAPLQTVVYDAGSGLGGLLSCRGSSVNRHAAIRSR